MEQNKKQEVHTHKIGIYLWIWGLLYSYLVSFPTWLIIWNFKGCLDGL